MPRSSRSRRTENRQDTRNKRHLQPISSHGIADDLKAVVSGLGVGFVVVGLLSLGSLRLVFMGVLFIAKRLFPQRRHGRRSLPISLLRTTTDKVLNEELEAYLEDSCEHWQRQGCPTWRIVINVLWFLIGASYAKVMMLIQVQFHRSL